MKKSKKRNLGNVFQLGELESEAKTTKKNGDQRAGVAEDVQPDLFGAILLCFGNLGLAPRKPQLWPIEASW